MPVRALLAPGGPGLLALAGAFAAACQRSPPGDAPPSPAPSSAPAAFAPCTPPHVEVVAPPSAATDTTIVFLHGYGGNAADIVPAARALANGIHAAAIVPDGCDPFEEGGADARQWMSMRSIPPAKVPARVREAAARLEAWLATELLSRGLPTKRVVFAGFSQGAILSLYLATHHTPAPAAIVSFSGKAVDVDDAKAPAGLPVLLVHGARDTVLPITLDDDAERLLLARGARVSRITRPAMGHAIDHESISGAIAFLKEALGDAP